MRRLLLHLLVSKSSKLKTPKLCGQLGTLCFFLRGEPGSLLGSRALTLPCSDTGLAQSQPGSWSALCFWISCGVWSYARPLSEWVAC